MPVLVQLLPFLPLGLLAGLLSGLLGIGGGVVFSPLLLLVGLPPHQALATSTLAIVPTTLASSITHLRSGTLPGRPALVMASVAAVAALLCSRLGSLLPPAALLLLQAGMYAVLTVTIGPRSALQPDTAAVQPPRLVSLAAVAAVAGLASGLVGVGGGLLMVPLLVRGLAVPVHHAIRLSTVAVLSSALLASVSFLADGRAMPAAGLLLGGTAAVGSAWAARHLQRVGERQLVLLLRGVTLAVALDSGRRALLLLPG
jgi:uncharacterized membrane protein YfcA